MRILGISGSLRRDSHNTALLRAAQQLAPEGIQLELYDELELIPPYNEDRDGDAAPEEVTRLRELVAGADALLIATPEYNGSIPGQLKTAVDWLSRPKGQGALYGKDVAVIGASTGSYGGIWAQTELRKSLGIAGARVVGSELAIPRAGDHLYEDGEIADGATCKSLVKVLNDLAGAAQPVALAA
jgi:NAD(P)H-dependent FMN reductase